MEKLFVQVINRSAVLLSLVPPPGLGSPVTCTSPGLQCAVAGPSLLAAVPRVAGLQQCRGLCRDRDQCRYLSYHDQAAAPASHFCLLFTSCDTVTPCTHCVSERRDCLMDTCGSSIVGDLDENVLSSIPNTESEMECKELCSNNKECAFYTYFHPADSLYPRLCFLQTELAPPVQPRPSCSTGPANCSAAAPCSLALGSSGQGATSLVLTSLTDTQDITVRGWGPCTVSMLVVGGGGQGGGAGYGGGAGAGHLQFLSVQLEPGTKLRAKVGDQRQASSVTFSDASLAPVSAAAGGDAHGSHGGDGYSGGGDNSGPYSGGSDGGDGEGEDGGAGGGHLV